MAKRISLIGIAAAFAACVSLAPVSPAHAAEWTCDISQPIPGGMLRLRLSGDGTGIASASGAVELYTAAAPPPLGLRDGTYVWDAPRAELAATGGVLSLQYTVALPLSEMPAWGTATGNLTPTSLLAALPLLQSPLGDPLQISNLMVISGNGIYNTNHDWSVRGGGACILLTNAPEPLSLIYSRELLQLISSDPNEPISLFLTPAAPGATDSIASFHTGGLLEAPTRVAELMDIFVASGSNCQTPGAAAQP
jgi:hypothetical protein